MTNCLYVINLRSSSCREGTGQKGGVSNAEILLLVASAPCQSFSACSQGAKSGARYVNTNMTESFLHFAQWHYNRIAISLGSVEAVLYSPEAWPTPPTVSRPLHALACCAIRVFCLPPPERRWFSLEMPLRKDNGSYPAPLTVAVTMSDLACVPGRGDRLLHKSRIPHPASHAPRLSRTGVG